jgi:hypothetical protein
LFKFFECCEEFGQFDDEGGDGGEVGEGFELVGFEGDCRRIL